MQWYIHADDLQRVAQMQVRCRLPFVLDHLAGMTEEAARGHTYWSELEKLSAAGAWVKLFGEKLVWGSDWPHTSFAAKQGPTYDQPAQVNAAAAAASLHLRRSL